MIVKEYHTFQPISEICRLIGLEEPSEDPNLRMPSESAFRSCWFSPEEALNKLTFEHDQEVLRKATGLVREEIGRRVGKVNGV